MNWVRTDDVPSWVFGNNYGYWTMAQYHDSTYRVNVVSDSNYHLMTSDNVICLEQIGYNHKVPYVVRPVIVLSKSVLAD